MNRRATSTLVGALLLLAAAAVQLYRFILGPMPAWAGPTAWALTLACLPGGAWLLATARTPHSPTTTDGLDAE